MYHLLAEIDFGSDVAKTYFPPARILNLSFLLNFIIPFITIGAALGFLFMLLFAAFTWLTAGGSSENVAKAQKTMTFAVLGLILVVVSFAATKIIGMIFGTGSAMPF